MKHVVLDAPGIYEIFHSPSNKVYIGSSIHVATRMAEHRRALKRGNHANQYLQRAWAAHSDAAFEFRVLEYVSHPEGLRARERELIISRKAAEPMHGFNLATATTAAFGHSRETRQKLSAILIGHKRNVGSHLSDEHKAKISMAQKGIPKPPDQVLRLRNAMLGKNQSIESIEKRRAANTGKKRSAESRQRMSAAAKARGLSPRFHAAALLKNTGRTLSEQHRTAISAGIKSAWSQRRLAAKEST
jgi:group I intron endonuclease